MKTINTKLIFISFFTLSLCLLSGNVYANKVTKLKLTPSQGFEKAPEIKVTSLDGEKWSVIDKTNQSEVSLGFAGKCRYSSRGNANYSGSLSVAGFEAIGKTEPASIYIPHSSQASGLFQYIDNGEEAVDLAKVCNDALAEKVANEPNQKLDPKFRKYAFLSEGFKVNYPNALSARYKLICNPKWGGKGDIESRSANVNAVIDCQASALAKDKLPVDIKKANFIPLIKSVNFIAKPKFIKGQCKAAIDFDGKIIANRPGEVKYQYVSKDGDKSPVFTLNFKKAGALETNNWNDIVAKSDTTKSLALSGSSKTADISGWWKLNVLSPQSAKTATAKFDVNCPKTAVFIKPKPKVTLKRGT